MSIDAATLKVISIVKDHSEGITAVDIVIRMGRYGRKPRAAIYSVFAAEDMELIEAVDESFPRRYRVTEKGQES